MERIQILMFSLALASCLLLTGCFTAMSDIGGSPVPTKRMVTSAALDIVTLPVQVPLIGILLVHHRVDETLANRGPDEEMLEKIRNDPDILFRKHLYFPYSPYRQAAFSALGDHSIVFAADQLEYVYHNATRSDLRQVILSNPHCSEAFLKTEWKQMKQDLEQADVDLLASLMNNPKIPSEWLEYVAKNGDLSSRMKALSHLVKNHQGNNAGVDNPD